MHQSPSAFERCACGRDGISERLEIDLENFAFGNRFQTLERRRSNDRLPIGDHPSRDDSDHVTSACAIHNPGALRAAILRRPFNRVGQFVDASSQFNNDAIRRQLPLAFDPPNLVTRSFDGRGNYSMGVTEQLIFAEIDYDKVDRTRGMDITFVTSAKTDDEAKALLDAFGFPFKR